MPRPGIERKGRRFQTIMKPVNPVELWLGTAIAVSVASTFACYVALAVCMRPPVPVPARK